MRILITVLKLPGVTVFFVDTYLTENSKRLSVPGVRVAVSCILPAVSKILEDPPLLNISKPTPVAAGFTVDVFANTEAPPSVSAVPVVVSVTVVAPAPQPVSFIGTVKELTLVLAWLPKSLTDTSGKVNEGVLLSRVQVLSLTVPVKVICAVSLAAIAGRQRPAMTIVSAAAVLKLTLFFLIFMPSLTDTPE